MMPPPKRASGPYRPLRLGQWEVVAKIAGGGMSTIYLGRRLEPQGAWPSVVALKIARHDAAADPRMMNLFLQEGRLLARLLHPNVVRVLEVGADEEQNFIAMELMLGNTFAAIHDALVARKVRLNPDIAAWAAARVAEALHYAHELVDEHGRPLGLVHRDVNPANVFATFDGEVKLFDFGLAKATSRASSSALVAGKVSYLSPEQLMQMPLDRRSDVFSLGTTLWELLTSRRLFRRDNDVDTIRAVQVGPIPDVRTVAPDLPEALARIVAGTLQRNREHRYPTAAHLAHDLDAYVRARHSPADMAARLSKLVGTLFPEEQQRQSGWLKPTVAPASSSRPGASVRPGPPPPRMTPPPLAATVVSPPLSPSIPPPLSPRPSAPPSARPTTPPLSPRPSTPPSARPTAPPPPAAASVAPHARASVPPVTRPVPPRESLFPGAGARPKRAPVPLPSGRLRGSMPPPARPSAAPPPMPVPAEPEAELASDTTEIDALPPDTIGPDRP